MEYKSILRELFKKGLYLSEIYYNREDDKFACEFRDTTTDEIVRKADMPKDTIRGWDEYNLWVDVIFRTVLSSLEPSND